MLTHLSVEGGAIYTRAFSLARELVRMGHQATVLASAARPGPGSMQQVVDGVQIECVSGTRLPGLRGKGYDPIEVLGRLRWLREVGCFDLVHAFGHRPAVIVPASAARRRWRAPVVVDWADLWGWHGIAAERSGLGRLTIGVLDDLLERRSRLTADGMTTVSSWLAASAVSEGVPEQRVLHLPPGAPVDRIRPLPRPVARRRLGLPQERPLILYGGLSSFDRPMALEVIVRAARSDSKLCFLLLGASIAAHERELEQAGVGDRVLRLGALDYATYGMALSAADLMLLPLERRTMDTARFPQRAGDALAAGLPIVATDVGDLGGLVAAHEVGVICPAEPSALASAVVALLRSPSRRRAMSRRARRLAEESYAWHYRALALLGFYQNLLSECSRERDEAQTSPRG